MLNRRPEQITLYNLVEAVEGPLVGSISACQVLSEHTKDKVRIALDNVAAVTRTELNRLTLAQLL